MKKQLNINIQKIHSFNWCSIRNINFLLVTLVNQQKFYIRIPKENLLKKEKKKLYLETINEELQKASFLHVQRSISTFYKPQQRNIYFKGLGFKCRFSTQQKNFLEFKLGFSHLTTIELPTKEIKVFIVKKNKLSIESFNKSMLGNLVQKIRQLKYPDSYCGRGFWYKNEQILLKEVKKTQK